MKESSITIAIRQRVARVFYSKTNNCVESIRMSGRGRGNYKGRGKLGRGGGGKKTPSTGSSNTSTATKKPSDFKYYLGTAKQASDFTNTTEHWINHIQKTFSHGNDIATALETLEDTNLDIDKPRLKLSKDPDRDSRSAEDEMIITEYKHEIGLFIKRKQEYKENLTKAYALLWSQCAKGMQIKIEARTDYTSIKGNPILLLKAIKEHALNYQENRYSVAIVYESIKNMLATKQREGESLQDYTRRFKTALDVMEGHLGG